MRSTELVGVIFKQEGYDYKAPLYTILSSTEEGPSPVWLGVLECLHAIEDVPWEGLHPAMYPQHDGRLWLRLGVPQEELVAEVKRLAEAARQALPEAQGGRIILEVYHLQRLR